MIQLQQKILNKRCTATRAAVLWPLVLYSLIQLAASLFLTTTTNTKITLQQTSPQLSAENLHFEAMQQCHTKDDQVFKTTKNLKLCSSATEISSSIPLLSSPALLPSSKSSSTSAYLHSLLKIFNNFDFGLNKILSSRKLVLLAEATSFSHHHHYHHPHRNQDGGIIILNSTNFNTELIQHNHPFPHLKLIEYYVSFSRVCTKFKPTYAKIAAEIYPWRNVIRPSAIDLSISTNSPIAHSWSINTIPTMRIYPPPRQSLAEQLDKQLSTWSLKLNQSELQKAMFSEYSSANLMVRQLEVQQYMDDASLLKLDLVHHIENYVRNNDQSELPPSWPNLKPVVETSLLELYRNHPRQELFLIIEGPAMTSVLDQSSSTSGSSNNNGISASVPLSLHLMLELSSKAPLKAIRYVRASENKALIEDVIAQQRKVVSEQSNNQIVEQTNLLNNLLSNNYNDNSNNNQAGSNNNNILLVHVDDSHSLAKSETPNAVFPFMTIVTSKDLLALEKSISAANKLIEQNVATKRSTINHLMRDRRASSSSDQAEDLLKNIERKIKPFALYIKQTYTDTNEDRDFVKAINNFDESSRFDFDSSSSSLDNSPSHNNEALPISLLDRFLKLFNSSSDKAYKVISTSSSSSCDYEDKLKAIHYLLFKEVPRASFIDKNLKEQQEKLSILVNLITVIKSYFPLPDLPSIQFIDGVQSYLIKQQTRLANINNEKVENGFDTRLFKQELKRLESEDKRLPEVKHWKYCTGYPCALWRLFHTLTAFEYKKLSQIRQPSTLKLPSSAQLQPLLSSSSTGLQQSDNNLSPSVGAITMNSSNLTPVERLVSPPSTTTSLSLTIVAPSSTSSQQVASQMDNNISNNNFKQQPLSEADLPTPVILVMRDYITSFFSCLECATLYRVETADLSFERIRQQQEPAEFSILWLWETHNRVNKRLSVDSSTNPPDRPKVWFPTFDQCATCYKKPPSFLQDSTTSVLDATIFHEPIEWNKQEVLRYLLCEYTKQPMDSHINLFGDEVAYGFKYIIVTCLALLLLIVLLRCTTYYIERQRRHKATLLNGNGAHYSLELH